MKIAARITGWTAAARSLGPWGWGSLAALLVAATTIISALPEVLGALVAPSSTAVSEASPDNSRVETFRASFSTHLAQFNGRSMFFVPPRPTPPPAEVESSEPEEPPPPARYGGPAIIAMINRTVWFEGGNRLREDEAASGGLRVVSVNAPWGARIEWRGQEWDVPLFDRTTSRFLEQPNAAKAESPERPTSDETGEAPSHD
ncbi:MAG: hypothetical protein JNK58_03240 [Phycisphaerae bacterium]|nr:hypothetical protein [Phycisphaerae bacterium]